MRAKMLTGLALAGALMLVAVLSFSMEPSAYAAPAAQITPVANVVDAPLPAYNANWLLRTQLTQGRVTRGLNLGNYAKADVQVVVDVTDANTVTLTLQHSNDEENWVDGPVVADGITADANTLEQVALFGRYTRLEVTLGMTNPVTVTVMGIAK